MVNNTPQIDPYVLCDAWLEAHFQHPSRHNPITTGLFHRSAENTSSDSHLSQESGGRASSLNDWRPPKRPRLLLNATACLGEVLDDNGTHSRVPDHIYNTGFGGSTGSVELPSHRPRAASGWGYIDGDGAGGGVARSGGEGRDAVVVSRVGGHADGTDHTGQQIDNDDPGSSWESAVRCSFTGSVNTGSLAMPPPSKRKSGSSSPSKVSSDTREKRRKLSQAQPAGTFGIPDLINLEPMGSEPMPEGLIRILRLFSVGSFEMACFPRTPDIEDLLDKHFRHELIPPHARFEITTEEESSWALELVRFAIDIHLTCLQNSRKAEDEAAWYPLVRSLLSVEPPQGSSAVPRPPRLSYSSRPTPEDLFLTVDATTKPTSPALGPKANVKLDALLAFNPEHRTCAPVLASAVQAGIKVNAFSDSILRDAVVILGVEVKSSGGSGGEMEAEYQVGVWGMKTLSLTRSLGDSGLSRCDYALSVSVCGHVWNLHVTYWRGDGMVTHGPVSVGATDTLYGTMKVVAFVRRFKEWARDHLWGDWQALLRQAEDRLHISADANVANDDFGIIPA